MNARLHDVLARHVEDGTIPGAVALVSHRGEVDVEVLGARSVGGPPLTRDSLFRISSMSKPITAVAVMTLVEDCVLRLDEPVDRLLPELADRRVLRAMESELDDTVPANRPITVRDLLTFRLGFGHVMAPPDAYPVLRAATDAGIGMGPPKPAEYPAPDEWLRRLGELPLMAQPGEKWLYHVGMDIAGVLVARASGRSFEEYLAERVFGPLGMVDTSFTVPSSKLDRLVTSYMGADVFDDAATGEWAKPQAFHSGGGGLVSTVDDMWAFAEMLRDGGGHVLSRPTVELMTTDQLTPAQKAVSGFYPGFFDSIGWGFGMSVTTVRDNVFSVGRYGWDGGLGTSWQNDPREELTGLLFTQAAAFPQQSPVYLDFWTTVYASLTD